MTTIRLALNELRRVTSGRMPLLVTVALLLVPLFYGASYLVSDDQADAKVHKLPAALVVADQGTTQDGQQVNVGKDIASALGDSAAFDWTPTDAADAADGLRSGQYSFALTLPKQFSTALTGKQHDQQTNLLQLKTNNAQNYLGPAIARQVSSAVRDAVAQTVGEGAANRLSIGFSGSAGRLADAGATAKQLADGASTLRDDAVQNSNSIGKLNKTQQKVTQSNQQLAGDSADLSNGLNDARDQANALPDQATQLATDSKKTADKSASTVGAGNQLAGAANKLDGTMSHMSGRLKKELRGKVSKRELNKVAGIVDDAKSPVTDAKQTVRKTNGQLGSLADAAKQSSSEANKVSSTAAGVAKPVSNAAKSARKMTEQAGKAQQAAKGAGDTSSKLVGSSTQLRNHVGSVAGSAGKIQQQLTTTPVSGHKADDKPVQVQSTGAAKASSHNAGLAPFFLALAMWVGVFALYLFLRPLSARALAARTPAWRVALAGWLPAALLAMVQAVLVYVTVVLSLGITPSRPILAGVFLMGTGLAFTALLHGLGALFGTGGRIAWLALMVLQLFTTPGALPAQTLPGPLHALNSVLPMGYAADGVRQLCYAGTLTATLTDVLVLAGWAVVGLALGTLAGRTKRVWTAARIRPELAV